jgi:hypothetical protein
LLGVFPDTAIQLLALSQDQVNLHQSAGEQDHQLVQQERITRQQVTGLFLYCSSDTAVRRRQLLARQALSDVPGSAAAEVSAEELKASLVLFSSLLDEQQRRLYAGLRITRPKLLPKWNYTIAPLNVK